MKRRIYPVIWLCAILMLSACGRGEPHHSPLPADVSRPAGSTAIAVAESSAVENILLFRDSAGVPGPAVDRFTASDNPLHAVIQLSGVEMGTKVRAELVAVDAGGEEDYTVAEEDLTVDMGGRSANFTIELPRPWPPGTYRVDVYLNGRPARALEFEIE